MNTTNEPRWSVRDLARIAGTTVRTIHYYIGEGLLPPASGVKRGATYGEAHLARLRLIAALRDEGLALSSIRQRLAPLSDDQAIAVAQTLDEHFARGEERPVPVSTLGLIEAALARETTIADDAHEVVADAGAPPLFATRAWSAPSRRSNDTMVARSSLSSEPREEDSASDYLDELLRRRERADVPRAPVRPRPLPSARSPAMSSDRPVAWRHFPVADGVELLVREDRFNEAGGRARAVIDALRDVLRRHGLSPPAPPDSGERDA